jgi:hypothetical protein
MKIIASILFAAAVLSAPTAALAATSAESAFCGPDGPEAYKRAGGFCDLLRNPQGDSITKPGEGCEITVGMLGQQLDRLDLAVIPLDECGNPIWSPCTGMLPVMPLHIVGNQRTLVAAC